MKLEVGMYVRTKKGIAKVTSMLDETHQYIVYTDNENIVFEYYLTKDYLNNKSKWVSDYASKYSFNIIDLIEVGDYVNGVRIDELSHNRFTNAKAVATNNSLRYDTGKQYWFENEDIKSIVTKEQFEAMAYKVV